MTHCRALTDVLAVSPAAAVYRSSHRIAHSFINIHRLVNRHATREICIARAVPSKALQEQGRAVAVPSNPGFLDLPVQADRALPAALAAVAALSWFLWRQMKNGKLFKRTPSKDSEYDAALQASTAQDGREYRMALARTRQAVAVHRAIGFLNGNNTARAMVELRRALHENSVCRSPLLNTQLEAKELQKLYTLHLQNTSQPADFATLLQLRTLLDLDFDVAEKLEREIMEQGAAYSI